MSLDAVLVSECVCLWVVMSRADPVRCSMSEHAKRICERIVAAPGVDVTAHATWSPETDLGTQPGWRFWRESKTAEGKPAHGVGSLLAKL